MRGIFLVLFGTCALASADTISHPEDRAIFTIARFIQHHSSEHGGWLPRSWEVLKKEIPAAAAFLNGEGGKHRLEERYAFVDPPLEFAESPGAPPRRLIAFSRWLEVKGPWHSERIERRLMVLDEKGNIRVPSLPERFVQQQLNRSGGDSAELFGKGQVFVPKWGIFSRPRARRNGILAAVSAPLLIGLGVWMWNRARSQRSAFGPLTPDAR
jgi:hypothetical protein